MKQLPQVIWSANRGAGRHGRDGWSFPRAVERHLRRETAGGTVLHLFGGKASWGTRLDIDAALRPDVLGDAWLPPFASQSFDAVVLDPPYERFSAQELDVLLRVAAMIARLSVWWFHLVWCPSRKFLRPARGWLVRVGDLCRVRALQELTPVREYCGWPRWAKRGPAVKYNRWLYEAALPLLPSRAEGAGRPCG